MKNSLFPPWLVIFFLINTFNSKLGVYFLLNEKSPRSDLRLVKKFSFLINKLRSCLKIKWRWYFIEHGSIDSTIDLTRLWDGIYPDMEVIHEVLYYSPSCLCYALFSWTPKSKKLLQYLSHRMFAAYAWSIKCRRK